MSIEISIYYIIFFILSFIALLSLTIQGKKYTFVLLVVVSVLLVLFAGLREGSPDQGSFRDFFYEVASLGEVLTGEHNYDENYIEWGYKFLLSVIKFFTDNDIIMFVVIASLSVGMVAYSCRRISPYPLISILCYYSWLYYSNLGALRHALASSLILLMIVFLAMKKTKLSVPIFLFATSVHRVTAAAFVIWFVNIIIRWHFLVALLLIVAIGISYQGGIGFKVASILFPYTGDLVQGKLQGYALDEKWGVSNVFVRGIVIKQLLISLLCLFYFRTLKKNFSAFPIAFGAYFVSLLMLLLFRDFTIINNRVSNVFIICEIILIPMIFSLFPGREKIFAYFVLVLVMLYQVSRLVGDQFYPYKFVFL